MTQAVAKEQFGILLASWTAGTFISSLDTFLLEVNSGAGWATVPSTQYAVHWSTGEIIKRGFDDDSGDPIDWNESYTYRCTYTKINSTTLAENTYTQEAQTVSYLDEFVAMDEEGELNASAPRDLVVQKIHAGSGYIGKWTITRTYLARDTGTDATSAGMAPLDYPFYAGATYANRATANFRVTPAGDVVMNGSLTVGGSVTVSGTLTVSGTIKSDDYVANSKGWKIAASGKAEFRDIEARGEFHAAVFVKDLIKATGGSEIIAKSAGSVKTAFTSVDSPTTFNVDVKDPPTGHAQLFAVNDILRFKNEAGSDTWVTVSSVSDQTTFYRYVCVKSNGTNATFQPGTVIVDYGASGQGFLFLTADDADAPYYSVRTHAGSPWTTTTERGRFGNMRNAFGTGANNYYGFGVGDYAGSNYLKYETNGGFRLSAGAGGVIIDGTGLMLGNGSGANYLFWGTSTAAISTRYETILTAGAPGYILHRTFVNDSGVEEDGAWAISVKNKSGGSTGAGVTFYFVANNNGGLTGALNGTTGTYARLAKGSIGTFIGLMIDAVEDGVDYPASLLHLKSTAPTLRMQDTTASAKSLLLTVDADDAIFKEVAGSALLTLELDNSLVLLGSGTLSGAAPAGSLFAARYNGSANADHLVGAFIGNWTGTTGASMQGVEGYVTANHASGILTNVLGVIGHGEAIGAGTITNMVAFESSNITNTGAGLITNSYNFRASPLVRVGGGSVTNAYGFFADTMTSTGVTNRWAFYSAGASDKSYFAGQVGIGATSPTSGYGLETSTSILVNSSSNNQGVDIIFTGASSSSVGPQSSFTTNDGAAMASSDRIGTMLFRGHDGSTTALGAAIIVTASELWSGTARGTRITFHTTANTLTTLYDSLIVDAGGTSINADDTGTATLAGLTITHNTTGTPAANFGTRVWFAAKSTTTDGQTLGLIDTYWVVPTHASRTARSVFYIHDTAAREALRIEASGTAAMLGFYGVAAVARPSAYTQTYSTADKTHANLTSTSIAAAIPAAAPAGGVGTAAGGWSTAANRDSAITTINGLRTWALEVDTDYEAMLVDLTDLKQLVNSVIDDLQSLGLLQ